MVIRELPVNFNYGVVATCATVIVIVIVIVVLIIIIIIIIMHMFELIRECGECAR